MNKKEVIRNLKNIIDSEKHKYADLQNYKRSLVYQIEQSYILIKEQEKELKGLKKHYIKAKSDLLWYKQNVGTIINLRGEK